MANQADFIKAAQAMGFKEDIIKYKLNEIKEIEKEGHYISWQWYIDKLPKDTSKDQKAIYHH